MIAMGSSSGCLLSVQQIQCQSWQHFSGTQRAAAPRSKEAAQEDGVFWRWRLHNCAETPASPCCLEAALGIHCCLLHPLLSAMAGTDRHLACLAALENRTK